MRREARPEVTTRAGSVRASPSVAFALVVLVCVPRASAGDGAPSRYAAVPFLLSGRVERIVPADVDGDGLTDIVCAVDDRIEVCLHRRGDGISIGRPDAVLAFGSESVAWDLDATGAGVRVVAIVGGTRVLAWELQREPPGFSKPVTLLEGARAFLPPGVRHLRFVRDVDGDGRADIVLPGAGVFDVYLRGRDGELGAPFRLASRVDVNARLDRGDGDLTRRIGETVSIPRLVLRDVNGDGLGDVVSKSDERLAVHLARASGGFEARPAYALDLTRIEARLENFDADRIDLSNLTGFLAWTYQTELEDVDGDGQIDLLLREGGKVSLFRGRRDGMDLERPVQVLRSGGNVVTAILRDENGDGLRDLWLVRVEAVSVGDVFVWLVASGTIAFETFVYRNEGSRFSRRPSRKLTVTLRFPSILSMLELREQLEKRFGEVEDALTARADVSGDGRRDDLLVLRGGTLQCYLDTAYTGTESADLLQLIGYEPERDEYALDLETLLDRIVLGGRTLLDGLGTRPPDLTIPVLVEPHGSELIVLDLNGDTHEDVIVLTQGDRAGVWGAVVLSGKPD